MKKTMSTMLLTLVGMAALAQGSVLASGDWWRLTVAESGVHRLTVADLPALQGVPVAGIGIYGGDGRQLSTANAETSTADLRPVAIEVTDQNSNGVFDASDQILFYGEGCDTWRYVPEDARWEMSRHAYSTDNHYYLTTTAPTPRRIAAKSVDGAAATVTTYTAVTVHNDDLTSMYKTGQLWMGEKFSSSVQTRTVTLSLPAVADGLLLRYALANRSTATASFDVSTTGMSTSNIVSGHTGYATVLEATSANASQLTINFTYYPGENSAEGFLDYIEMSGHVPLAFAGTPIIVRNDQAMGGKARFTMANGNAAHVWDVTDPVNVRSLAVSGGAWTDSTDIHRTYAVFGATGFATPKAIVQIDNQDLHGSAAADYVIVTNEAFLQQANTLAALHRTLDELSTLVVTDRQVYNEFSSGKQDPMAIRSFMRWLRDSHPDHAPRYLLLFGKATYDPRNLTGHDLPTVVTYETELSFDEDGISLCSDDMMGYLDPDDTGSPSQTIEIGIGRLPAKSAAEADHMVDKIEGYMTRRDLGDEGLRGDWRNYVALLADDADPSHPGDTAFAHSSEVVARRIKDIAPTLNIDRLYADAYQQQSGAIGSFYPDLNNALRQRMNYGCLLLNYIGHGSIKYIGTERYIEPSDIAAYSNVDRLPVFITSTCSYGYHDLIDDECGAEACLLAPGAAVAVVSASRPISHSERFNSNLIAYTLDPDNGIGDALRMARNSTPASMSIGLIGDPALRLALPRNEVVVTEINDRPVTDGVNDTAKVLSQVTVRGEIRDGDGNLLTDFDGTVYPIVFDRETQSTTLANDNPGTEVTFSQQKSVIYKGNEAVVGGRFEYTFTVPSDVSHQYAHGKLSHYARSGHDDAAGQYGRLTFGGLDESVTVSETRPTIRLHMGDTTFRNGGITDANPTLVALLSDSVGINAFGSGLGHDITATIDGEAGTLVVLNDFYQADLDDSRRGTIRYTFADLAPGRHTLTLKAWNIWGYSNSESIDFVVKATDSTRFSDLSAYPNPARDQVTFHFETNNAAAITSATLQIFSPQGALIHTITPTVEPGSYVVGPIRWDLSQVSPGMYIGRMLVTTDDGDTHSAMTKVMKF